MRDGEIANFIFETSDERRKILKDFTDTLESAAGGSGGDGEAARRNTPKILAMF